MASLPAFAWNPSPGAHHYEFQVSADAGFNSPVLGYGNDRFFTGNTRATLKKTIPNGTLWWRVRAATEAGAVSPWSAVRSVKKAWTSAPTLLSPAYDATLTYPSSPFKLSWSPTPGAAKYLVTLATDPALGSPVWTPVETAAAQFSRAPALAPGRYYWGVTPIDAQGNSGKPSSVGTFTWAWPTTTSTSLNDLVSASGGVRPALFMERTSRRGPVRGGGQLILGLHARLEGLLLRHHPRDGVRFHGPLREQHVLLAHPRPGPSRQRRCLEPRPGLRQDVRQRRARDRAEHQEPPLARQPRGSRDGCRSRDPRLPDAGADRDLGPGPGRLELPRRGHLLRRRCRHLRLDTWRH